jgi:hypothetical protein
MPHQIGLAFLGSRASSSGVKNWCRRTAQPRWPSGEIRHYPGPVAWLQV